uniref:Bulb-type lectin domain-containing protein n=1 Tax=Davidia involucrata TaxID=16924 RepID=A0A5B6YKG5_DAVIN
MCQHRSLFSILLQQPKHLREWSRLSNEPDCQLQFFSPGDSNRHYLGIQCMNISLDLCHSSSIVEYIKVVWAANHDKPLRDTFGVLYVNQVGNLVITHKDEISIILNSQRPAMSSTNTSTATLLNSGNLVVRAYCVTKF